MGGINSFGYSLVLFHFLYITYIDFSRLVASLKRKWDQIVSTYRLYAKQMRGLLGDPGVYVVIGLHRLIKE